MASTMDGLFCGRRFRENRRTLVPCLNASRRMPSNFRSKIHSGPVNRSCVSVAAIGTSQSGKEGGGVILLLDNGVVRRERPVGPAFGRRYGGPVGANTKWHRIIGHLCSRQLTRRPRGARPTGRLRCSPLSSLLRL